MIGASSSILTETSLGSQLPRANLPWVVPMAEHIPRLITTPEPESEPLLTSTDVLSPSERLFEPVLQRRRHLQVIPGSPLRATQQKLQRLLLTATFECDLEAEVTVLKPQFQAIYASNDKVIDQCFEHIGAALTSTLRLTLNRYRECFKGDNV